VWFLLLLQPLQVRAILCGFDFFDRFSHGLGFLLAEVFGEILLAFLE
jgi:hypothetical protein